MMPENLFQLAVKPSEGILMTEEKAIYISVHSAIITTGGRARKKKRRMSWERAGECSSSRKKRVMVLIDRTARAEQAMVWALTHVANKGDLVTLLHVLPPHCSGSAHREEETSRLIDSLGSICKAIRPQAINLLPSPSSSSSSSSCMEVLVIHGPKLATVLGQVKKLDVSVLVLKQSKPSPLCWYLHELFSRDPLPLCLDSAHPSNCSMMTSSREEFVKQCIDRAECQTMANNLPYRIGSSPPDRSNHGIDRDIGSNQLQSGSRTQDWTQPSRAEPHSGWVNARLRARPKETNKPNGIKAHAKGRGIVFAPAIDGSAWVPSSLVLSPSSRLRYPAGFTRDDEPT
ncbi:hypothetical protein B296_00055177 [Ensete ventricosum]|uniref:UspA domain-containing protein n=1 Tax=Ensete ventricosum TaxID=4639 RepID=A0A426Y0W0_ENSVE|nr:hypothetical protein B296_00055177 [Ensete ventricosum]